MLPVMEGVAPAKGVDTLYAHDRSRAFANLVLQDFKTYRLEFPLVFSLTCILKCSLINVIVVDLGMCYELRLPYAYFLLAKGCIRSWSLLRLSL